MPQETKDKIAAALRGIRRSDITIQKLREVQSRRGPVSDEVKEKIRKKALQNLSDPVFKAKVDAHNERQRSDPEYRKIMSLVLKNRMMPDRFYEHAREMGRLGKGIQRGPLTAEAKAIISAKAKERWNRPEFKKRMHGHFLKMNEIQAEKKRERADG